jgi:hypothetical protein
MFTGAGAIVQKLALAWLPVHISMIQEGHAGSRVCM